MPRVADAGLFIPHAHQLTARDAILAARESGAPGFLLGDLTGLGKTLSAWLALAAMPEQEVLVICPKGAIPQWRRTIALSGLPPKRVTLMNFEKTKSLLAPPADEPEALGAGRRTTSWPSTARRSASGRWW